MKKLRVQRSKSPPDMKYTANEVNDELTVRKERESKSPLHLNNQHNDVIKNSTKQILSPPSQTKLERASSFKKRSRPENVEKLTKDIAENKENNKRPSARSESRSSDKGLSEYNIALLGDLNVGKTGKIIFKRSNRNTCLKATFNMFVSSLCAFRGSPESVRKLDVIRGQKNFRRNGLNKVIVFNAFFFF